MTIDGTYGFVFCGTSGLGFGIFNVKAGAVIGRDAAGASYSGKATALPDGRIDLDLSLHVPAGVELVQGTAAQEVAHTRMIKQIMPPLFGDGEPVKVDTAPGPVNVMVKRVPDHFENVASEGLTVQTARQIGYPMR